MAKEIYEILGRPVTKEQYEAANNTEYTSSEREHEEPAINWIMSMVDTDIM
jgi:hypothetical protein